MKLVLAVFLLYLPQGLWGQEAPAVIAVGEADVVREKLFIAPLIRKGGLSEKDKAFAREYDKQLAGNFAFYRKYFQTLMVNSRGPLAESDFDSPDYRRWSAQSARYLIHSLLERRGGDLGLRVKVFDINENKEIFSERRTLPEEKNHRGFVHALCDRIYRKMTGRPSIFGSQIVFVSDVASQGKKIIKELYIMDFDGFNKRRLTWHRGIVISPAIGPQKKKVLYSLIRYNKGKKNVDLRILDLGTRKGRKLSSRPGLNSGAVFAPNGRSIYLTMSHQGNAEIYKMDLGTRKLQRITRYRGEDVDPSLDGSGNLMAFLSNRPGKAMVYIADAHGVEKNVRRISYTGRFNATPRFSPDGGEMAFASWVDNRFDIYRVSSNGNELTRLTRDFGSNESPSYSGDGEFIVFSSLRVISRRRAEQNLYIMDRNGEILGPVTKNFGKCLSPRWSK